jgi:hypothetical protein
MAAKPPAESYRYGNQPPPSRPTPNPFQPPQSLGWLEGAGTTTSTPRGGEWVNISDASPAGQRLFEARCFSTGDQGRSRGQRR